MTPSVTQSLRDYAADQVDEIIADQGPPIDDRDQMIRRWIRHLASVCAIPDDILETLPEVSGTTSHRSLHKNTSAAA